MSRLINVLLRGSALLWTLLVTALIGNAIANNHNGKVQALNYTMFVAAWSWIASLFGLAAAFVTAIALPLVMLPLDGFAVLFTFIDAILLAARLKAVNCSHPHEGHNWIGWGSHNTEKRCREIQASTAFMWFLWATFCASLVMTVIEWRGGFRGPSRSSKPSMSQVGA